VGNIQQDIKENVAQKNLIFVGALMAACVAILKNVGFT
jgi:hypothetical protein